MEKTNIITMETIAKETEIDEFIGSTANTVKLLVAKESSIKIPEIRNAPFANYSRWFRKKPTVGTWPLENVNNTRHYFYKGDLVHDFGEGYTFCKEGLIAESYGNEDFMRAICNNRKVPNLANENNTYISKKPIFVISSRWGFTNYWHWLLDVIPKFMLFIESEVAEHGIPCVIHEEIRHSYQTEWIQIIGNYAKEKNIEVISTSKRYIHSRELIWTNSLALPHPSRTLKNIYNRIIDKQNYISNETETMQRILLMRRKGGVRSISNYEEIEQWGEKNRFKIMLAEDYSANEQMRIFSECQVLISIHGAGMSNIVFMKNGSKVIELSPDSGFNPAIQDLCAACEMQYSLIICKSTGRNQIMEVNTISLDDAMTL